MISSFNIIKELYNLYEVYTNYILLSQELNKSFLKNVFLNHIFPNLYKFEFKDQVTFGPSLDKNTSSNNFEYNDDSLNLNTHPGDLIGDSDSKLKINKLPKNKEIDNKFNLDTNNNNNIIEDDSNFENLEDNQSDIDHQLINQDIIQDENKEQIENNLEDNNPNFEGQENGSFKDEDSEFNQSDSTYSNNNENDKKKINPIIHKIIKKIFQKISLMIHPDKIKYNKKKNLDLNLFFTFDDVYKFYKQGRLSILIYIAQKLNISFSNIIYFNQIIVDFIIIEMKKTIAKILNHYYLN